jgi:hypothetical protein
MVLDGQGTGSQAPSVERANCIGNCWAVAENLMGFVNYVTICLPESAKAMGLNVISV